MSEANEPPGIKPIDDELIADENTGPAVGRVGGGLSPVIPIVAFGAAALLLFTVLNGRREERQALAAIPARTAAASSAWTPPPLELPPTQVSATGPGPFAGLPAQVASIPVAAAVLPTVATSPIVPATVGADANARLHAPAVVVDLGGGSRETTLAQASTLPPGGGALSAPGGPGENPPRAQLNDSEQFARRVGNEEPDRARATTMRNLRAIAPQGTIIPGVLETAINSDLPGFTRAIVSRDVLSFDGRAVLIPRSSRLIGQYKSAVALGQSRAFIIWTRVIRPDGVSIQIGSPGTDELGRGGLDGEVNRHFLARFSGAILLTVLNAGVASIERTPSTQISIGSAGGVTSLAGSALQGDAIPPTIKVPQGEAINIFVARDLDFSSVAPIP